MSASASSVACAQPCDASAVSMYCAVAARSPRRFSAFCTPCGSSDGRCMRLPVETCMEALATAALARWRSARLRPEMMPSVMRMA